MKDLTSSNIERQNVLNNRFAVSKMQEHLDIEGMLFEGEYRFTKKMVADFYEIEERTIERYLEKYSDELSANGYILCKGKRLKELKLQFAHVINVGSKTTQLGLFNFRSFLNMGMLLTESEQAKKIRSQCRTGAKSELMPRHVTRILDKRRDSMYTKRVRTAGELAVP